MLAHGQANAARTTARSGMNAPRVVTPRYVVVARTTAKGIGELEAKSTTVRFDRSWNPAEPSDLPGPGELLASAFAACLIKNVERFGQVLDFDYRRAEVTVELHRIDAPPRFERLEYVLRIDTSEPERRVELLHRNLKKHGTVFNTLAATCDVTGTVIAWQSDHE